MSSNVFEVEEEDVVGKGMIHDRFLEVEEVNAILASVAEKANDEIAKELDLERLTTILNIYQEQPNLLDPHLERLLSTCLSVVRSNSEQWNVLHQTFRYMYTITKVRGCQAVQRCMPHETSDLQPVLAMLEKQSPTDGDTWQTRYVLLLWLSTLCLIPFDLARFDGFRGGETQGTMERLIAVGKRHIESGVHQVAALMLSTLLARPDARNTQLGLVLDWLLSSLADCDVSVLQGATCACSLLLTVAALFKRGRRSELLPHASRVLSSVSTRQDFADSDNILLRKYRVKVLQRCGLTFLRNRVAKWRYERGCRSLLVNLAATDSLQNNPTSQSSLAYKKTPDEMEVEKQEEAEEEEFEVSTEVEEVIGFLLESLKDRDTIVRWSAAKGVGRITNRLPKAFAMDIVSALLSSCSPLDGDAAWHGACLALAELARRGLLLPDTLGEVVRVALSALRYDEKRAAHSVGAHVRDAACYVCWSLARAFDASLMSSHVVPIAKGLVHAFLFDREVSVRRAASAAFQENVGRQGYFPHGIEILTTCDYFAVGNLQNAYLELSVFVGRFEEYGGSLVEQLVSLKLAHWDVHIRELAAKALHRLTAIVPAQVVNKLPMLLQCCLTGELYLRHGALLASAEVLHALYCESASRSMQLSDLIESHLREPADILHSYRVLPSKLAESGVFSQFGNEHMKRAACLFIEKLSESQVALDEQDIRRWLDLLDTCVRSNDVSVQKCATIGLRSFLRVHLHAQTLCKPFAAQLADRYRRELLDAPVEHIRVGLCAALGCLPAEMLLAKSSEQPETANLALVINTLIEASRPPPEQVKLAAARPDRFWTNSRAEAVRALISVVDTCSLAQALTVDGNLVHTVLNSVLDSLADYTIDPIKGDQGRKVREACLVALQSFASMVTRHRPELLTASLCEQLFGAVAQQAVEKIIQTRALACRTFFDLLYMQPALQVPHKEALQQVLPESLRQVDWSNGEVAFARYVKLLLLPGFAHRVTLGLVVSAGDLGEFRKASSNALVDSLNSSSLDQVVQFLRTLGDVFEKWTKNERVSLPLLRTLEQLLSSGCLLRSEVLDEPQSPTAMLFFEQLLRLVTLTRNEINRSLSANRILAAVDVFCGALQFEKLHEQLYRKCLSQIVILMAHSDIPRVRRSTATRLYEALLLYGDALNERCEAEQIDELNSLLNDTAWELEPVEQCRKVRNRICDILGLPHPVMQQRTTA